MPASVDFTALAAPVGDGETLLQPAAKHFSALVEQNRERLDSYRFSILDVDIQDLRLATGGSVVGQIEHPLIVTGHQPEFIHPGVWAKHVITQRLADRVGGLAVNLIVDNDAAKKTSLTVPVERSAGLEAVEVSFGPHRTGQAFEQFPVLPRQDLTAAEQSIRRALGAEFTKTLMPEVLAAASHRAPHDFVEQMIAARRAIDSAFGIDLLERRVSRTWGGPVLAAMIRDAERFAACYNAALADYRRTHGIQGTRSPVPDLQVGPDGVELPVWTYGPGEPRLRLFVARQGDRINLLAGRDLMGCVAAADLDRVETAGPALQQACQRVLRPRALSLTIWARLFLADVFIHGIGGAKYDQIADQIVRRYFGVEPPGMICASATLRLPLRRFDVGPADVATAVRRQRDLHYNPQRYVSLDGRAGELAQNRDHAIGRAEWLKSHDWSNHAARGEAFREIRQRNQQMVALAPHLPGEFAHRTGEVRRQVAHNRVAESREYFVGLFRPERLAELADRLGRELR